MLGYKAMDYDMTCRDFKYEIGQKYKKESDDKLEPCSDTGFHFCEQLAHVFNYYNFRYCRIFLVESGNNVVTKSDANGSKSVTDEITIVRELSAQEIVDILTETYVLGDIYMHTSEPLKFFRIKSDFERLVANGHKDLILTAMNDYLDVDNAKIAAIQVFESIGDVETIKSFMTSSNEQTRIAEQIINSLINLGHSDCLKQFSQSSYYGLRSYTVKQFSKLGDVDSIKNMLNDSNVYVVGDAIKELAKYGELESIKSVMSHDDFRVRCPIVYALKDFGDKESLKSMVNDDDDAYVASLALMSLAELGDKETIKEYMSDSRSEIRKTVIEAFELFGDVESIKAMLNDSNVFVQNQAISSLRNLGDIT